MMNKSRGFDCQRCGACCASDHVGFVEVTPRDRTPRELTVISPGTKTNDLTGELIAASLCSMRRVSGRCIALEGKIGRRVSCSIYDRRPAVCAGFEAGSADCLTARRMHRLRT